MTQQLQAKQEAIRASICLSEPVAAGDLRLIERALQLHHFKWDTQVGDDRVLFPHSLLIAQSAWDWLCTKAEKAARELFSLEQTIAGDPALQRRIGVPRALRKLLVPGASSNRLRTMRFDFHPTATGWLLSEVNTDVPGGFGEASALSALFKRFHEGAATPSCPLKAWGDAVAAEIAPGHVALLCAPGHLEDQQVILALGRELGQRGFIPHLIQSPAALRWRDGHAYLADEPAVIFNFVVRFFQAEWLTRLPVRSGWRELFKKQGATRVSNSPESVISESKRLPLCFGAGNAPCATLQEFFPECRGPGQLDEAEREDWVLKAAYSNTGDEVYIGAELPAPIWKQRLDVARRNPRGWIAQRRFETLAFESVRGPVRPCIGIFVIGNRAAGAYVRLSTGQVIDARALEAPLFVVPNS